MFGMQGKINEKWRGHQPGHAYKDAYARQCRPHSRPRVGARGQQKAQAIQEKQKGCETRRRVGGRQQPRAHASQRNPPPASAAADLLFPSPPQQGQTQTKQQWQELNSERRAPQHRLTDGNRQQTGPNSADQQAAPRSVLPAFISPKEKPPQPEDGKDRARAGQNRGQTNGQRRAPHKGDGRGYQVYSQPLAPITLFRKENGVLALQHPHSIHSIGPSVVIEPGRKFGQAMKTQHQYGQRQCNYDPPATNLRWRRSLLTDLAALAER